MDKKSNRRSYYERQETGRKKTSIYQAPRKTKKGFTLKEIFIVVAVIVVFFVAGALFFRITSMSAYDITAKHDLKKFADYQHYHYKLNTKCAGEQGQSVRNDGVSSDLTIENFVVSEGVCITIVSGDPKHPNDSDNPYVFQAKHEKSSRVYEYIFADGNIVER